MDDKWYYVQKGNRNGPVSKDVIESMIESQELKSDDFVWKKGFENWKKIKDVTELVLESKAPELPSEDDEEIASLGSAEATASESAADDHLQLQGVGGEERSIFIRIGNDRGAPPTDYGPFNLGQLKQLFKEHRINGKTMVFIPGGMKEWELLADFRDYEEVFHEVPPVIQDAERRTGVRKPFVARLFVQNNQKVFEGICRDISIGGVQVLMHDFKGTAGDRISINVHPENSEYHFVASGQVVRLLEGNSGFSFRFTGLGEEAKQSIEKYLQDN